MAHQSKQRPVGSTPNVRYGTIAPTVLPTDKKGDEYLVTPSGDNTTLATQARIFDGVSWELMPSGGTQQVYTSTSLVTPPANPADTTKPAVAYNLTTREIDWYWDTAGLVWRKAFNMDVLATITPTATTGTVATSQDTARIPNGTIPTASATYEGVILEVSGLTAPIIPTSGPLLGVGEMSNGDLIICENSNGTWVWKKLSDSGASDHGQLLTRAALITLRNAGQLIVGRTYVVTDHIQNRLVAGTTVAVHAIATNETSEMAEVNTTYDNEARRGIYDLDRGLVLELQDNRNNIARGFNGTEVSNFDWGNTNITNVLVDNATWTTTYGAARTVTNSQIKEGSILTTTGQTGGVINRLNLYGASQLNTTNANVGLSSFTSLNGSNVNLTAFTAGSTLTNWNVQGGTVNFSNSTSGVTISTVNIIASTINHTGVTTGTITGNNLIITGSSVISHNNGAGNLSLNRVNIENGSQINHTSGVIAIADYFIEGGSIITQNTGTTGNISISNGRMLGNSNILNQADYNINGTRLSLSENSAVNIQNGAIGVGTFNGVVIDTQSNVTIFSNATAGNLNITLSTLSNGSIIQKQNTGVLSINNSELSSQGRLIFNTVRNFTSSRLLLTNLGTMTLNAVAGAGVTDTVQDTTVGTRGSITFSATGATANSVLYTTCEGLSGLIQITGTSTGQVIQRSTVNNSTITMNNNVAPITLDFAYLENLSVITIQNMTVTKGLNYFNAKNSSTINVNNPTGAGNCLYLYAENAGTINVQGTATFCNYLYARNQGTINFNGGSVTNMTKEMPGAINTGAFAHTNVIVINPITATLTAINNGRSSYLGVASTLPLI